MLDLNKLNMNAVFVLVELECKPNVLF